ncbi:MAG: metallophosphoesterase family protein, partial [Tetragenococcus halophilus]|nr:metallophosphoesterase family protein [Tetragenococcus halophilus]
YMIFGNHDYYEEERYWFDFPTNVHLFKEEKVQTISGQTNAGERYFISGFSYLSPQISQKKVNEFPIKQTDYHIGMYHGDMSSKHFAPFQLQEMKNKNYDYWALGHIHVPTILSEEAAIIYAGTPQGHTQKEESTGVNYVMIDQGQVHWQIVDVSAVKWEQKEVSLSGISQQKAVLDEIIEAFQISERKLVKLSLKDTDLLPTYWLQEKEAQELLDYVNDYLDEHQFEQLVYQVDVVEELAAEKIALPADKKLLEQLLATYQQSDKFTETTNELISYPLATQAISMEQLQEETFKQIQEKLESEFSWRKLDGIKES